MTQPELTPQQQARVEAANRILHTPTPVREKALHTLTAADEPLRNRSEDFRREANQRRQDAGNLDADWALTQNTRAALLDRVADELEALVMPESEA